MSDFTTYVTRANDEGWWPAAPGDRIWSTTTMFGVAVSVSVATWVFIIGATAAAYLNFTQGVVAMLAGSMLGILIPVLAVLPITAKYGIDSVAALRPQMGTRGAYFGLILLALSVIGWNSVLTIFLGQASSQIGVSLGLVGADQAASVQIAVIAATVLGVWITLARGAQSVSMVGTLVALSVLVLSALIIFLIINGFGLDKLLAAKPAYASESHRYNFTTGVELLMAINLAWWPYIGGLVRLGNGPRRSMWPMILGIGLSVAGVSVIGLAATLAVPDSAGDPTKFLLQLAGPIGGVPILLFIILANFGTLLVGTYVFAVGIGQVTSLQGKLPWNVATLLGILPVFIVSTFFAEQLYGHIPVFLAFLGLTFAPVCGIQLADTFLLRRKASLTGIFVHGPGTPYHYVGGVNPFALVALVVGVATYMFLLDPLTFASSTPYEYVTATLPSVLLSGLSYAALMKWAAPKSWLES
ncbi:cytosine permease [Hyphomicrobium sp.]|uniref:cytosine permease n=1 Tax=Hyphomicrobium sp. TaxID=82 RepID=UPI001DFA497B|nr:cytosine permease [Hyphomicrobium sp.]MBY0558797.1 cytosine permease [Hyphomicrobium sp.]